MRYPEHIFKAYDMRGLVDGELSEELAYRVGRSFALLLAEKGIELQGKKLVVGRDMRPTSPAFSKNVLQGFIDSGIDAVDIGMTSTPVFNFTVANRDEFAGGIMVTASHNPAQYNGFKLTTGNGMPVGKGCGMERLRELAENGDFESVAENLGSIEEMDLRSEYVDKLFSLISPEDIKPLKIVIDGGNGMGEISFPMWLEKVPQVEVEYMYMEPDGTFPNHEANPLKAETLEDLSKKVLESGADMGFALDGDADRIGLVDEKGRVVEPSKVAAILAEEYLKGHPGIHALYDLRSSQILPDLYKSHGSTSQKSMVGHAQIKKMMTEVGAEFASEVSLHIFFGEFFGMESSDYCLLLLLKILSDGDSKLSELSDKFDGKYFHSGEINFEVEDKDGAIAKIRERFADEAKEDLELDGLWLGFDWGWLNVRKSNTEPFLRLNVESKSKDITDQKVAEIKAIVEN